MRYKLKELSDISRSARKFWWTAVVDAYSVNEDNGMHVLLLKKVRLRGEQEIKAHHLWLTGADALRFGYKEGTEVEFRGRVVRYTRSDGSEDYTIGAIKQVRSLS